MTRQTAKQLTDDALAELGQQLEQGRSEALTASLSAMSHMHNYSWNNTLLIALQRPQSTYVAGFRSWKKIGRHVMKGEKGIAIIAPMVNRKKAEADQATASETDEKSTQIRGFKVVHVFDVAQTDGKDLPEIHNITGEPGTYLNRLKQFIAEQSIELRYEHLGLATFGCSTGGTIRIKPGLSPASEFSVLVHETAHELLHKGKRRSETTKLIRETEAEAVAYVVTRACGLAGGTTSADYIKLYHGTPDSLAVSLEHIQKIACFIIVALRDRHIT